MTTATLLLPATVAAPLLLLAACAVPAARRHVPGLLWLAPLPGLAAALLAAGARPLVLDEARLRFTLALDLPAALLLGPCALLWCAAGVYARAYLGAKPGAERFAAWWLVTLFGSLGVFVAGDLVTFYCAFAAVSLAAYGLIVHDGTARARRAGAVTLLLAVVGEVCLLLGFALLAEAIPGQSLAIADAVAALPGAPSRAVTVALLVLGFGLKAGLVPLHVWLPLAHPAAPAPASAVLSGAIVKAGVIGLLRFLPPVEGAPLAEWGVVLAAVGFLTAFWGVGCGVTQANPKTVLAYSTVSQMGVVAATLGMGLLVGDAGISTIVAFYAAHHVLAKGALFLAAGVAAAGITQGRRRLWPVLLLPALVLALGVGGLPPTGGALAKAATKTLLGSGLAGTLAFLSAAGSTLLMLHFVRRLAATATSVPAARARPGLLLPWLGLAAAAVAVPWALYARLGLGDPLSVLAGDALWSALLPVLLGAAGFLALRRWGGRLPVVPEGDVLALALPAARAASLLGAAVGRVEAALRAWPLSGLVPLVLAAAFAAALLASFPP
jgi:formate hydrogenlyase subunit 3/multisubunit Na+/H+ antiporter MnhD subunit